MVEWWVATMVGKMAERRVELMVVH